MSQISRRWISDNAIDETKVASTTLGDGLTGGSGSKIEVNIGTGLKFEDGKLEVDVENVGGKSLDVFTLGDSKVEEGGNDSWSDGLLQFESTTNAAVALDKINEILKALAPAQPPALSNIEQPTTGVVAGKLSFGISNPIAGYTNHPTLNVGGTFNRIINASTNIQGYLNSNVTADASGAYPARAFKNGDKGSLQLIVNGVTIHEVDLTTFASGNSLNANGSGFISLSAATPVNAASGTIEAFKYRTGSYRVHSSDLGGGYNEIVVRHTDHTTNTNNATYVVDNATTATTINDASLDSFSMSGSLYLSGVRYHTSGSTNYFATIANAYRNTFSSSATAISHPTRTNCNVSSSALTDPSTEGDNVNLTRAVTINAGVNGRLRAASNGITLNTSVLRTLQGTQTGGSISGGSFLIENGNGQFGVETNRRKDTASLLTGTVENWDSQESLLSNNGLQFVDGGVKYPTENFNNDRYTTGYANPSYTTANGARSFVLEFTNALAAQNFTMAIGGVVAGDFVTASSFVSTGNKLKVEICVPNGTTNGTNYEWKDCMTNHDGNDNNIGARATSYGATIPSSWGLTIGGVSTAVFSNKWYIRVTAGEAWTGTITSLSCVRA